MSEINKDQIRKKITLAAKELYIPVLGFVKAGHFFNRNNHTQTRYQSSDDKQYLSSFVRRHRPVTKIIDPKKYKTIVSVLIPYMNPLMADPLMFEKKSAKEIFGKLSASSWGQDYHKVVKDMLSELCENTAEFTGQHEYMIMVDNVDFSEREMAVRAGLGRIGRNSNLIHPDTGSFVFIAEIATTLDLALEESTICATAADPCRNCYRCVTSCPVQAIDGSLRIVDSRKCLSQQTQEKEKTDPFIREKIKETGYVFGCDICQLVCPHNNKKLTIHPAFMPDKNDVLISAEELLLMSNREFKKKYGHLAASWRGKKPLAANAQILLT